MDTAPLKAMLSEAVDAWAAGEHAPAPPPPPPVAAPPAPPAPSPPPAGAPVITAGSAFGEVPGWENGIRYGNDADENTKNLVGLMTELDQQGGGTIKLNAAGPYQINGRIPLYSGVSLLRSTGVRLIYVGDPTLPAIFESPREDTLMDCALDLWIDEGANFSGDVVRMHSGALNTINVIGFGRGPNSRLYYVRPDSTGGEGRQGDRNFARNKVSLAHMGQCGTLARMEGLTNGFGGQPQVVTLNEFSNFFCADAVHRGIQLESWTDNITFDGFTRVAISGAQGVGFMVNEATPKVETGVYCVKLEDFAVDTWTHPGANEGRRGVVLGASKVMQCEMYHQDPSAEAGSFDGTNCISYYWRSKPAGANNIVILEKGVSAQSA